MKVSVIIPTCNRNHHWLRGLLPRALENQTVQPDEILVCDDGSSDETLLTLTTGYIKDPRVKVFRTVGPKIGPHWGASLAENVLFAEATGDVVLHIDDDGFIHERTVELVKALDWPAVYFGVNAFLDPITLEIRQWDQRISGFKLKDHQAAPLPKGFCCGALYAAPLATIRQIGGHSMEHAGYLGCDSRIGDCLSHHLSCWLLNMPEFTFYHLGITYSMHLKNREKPHDYSQWRTVGTGSCEDEVFVNGGESFWKDGLKGRYVRVI